MTLDQVSLNQEVTVLKVVGERPIKRRIMELGILPGKMIKVIKTAPLGDPIEVSIKSSTFSIRKRDAKNIIVE